MPNQISPAPSKVTGPKPSACLPENNKDKAIKGLVNAVLAKPQTRAISMTEQSIRTNQQTVCAPISRIGSKKRKGCSQPRPSPSLKKIAANRPHLADDILLSFMRPKAINELVDFVHNKDKSTPQLRDMFDTVGITGNDARRQWIGAVDLKWIDTTSTNQTNTDSQAIVLAELPHELCRQLNADEAVELANVLDKISDKVHMLLRDTLSKIKSDVIVFDQLDMYSADVIKKKITYFDSIFDQLRKSFHESEQLIKDYCNKSDFEMADADLVQRQFRAFNYGVFKVTSSALYNQLMPVLKLRTPLPTQKQAQNSWKAICKLVDDSHAKQNAVDGFACVNMTNRGGKHINDFSYSNQKSTRCRESTRGNRGTASKVDGYDLITTPKWSYSSLMADTVKKFFKFCIVDKKNNQAVSSNISHFIQDKTSSVYEYRIGMAISILAQLVKTDACDNPSDSPGSFSIFDPCGGWGNRIYAMLATMQQGHINYFSASDPNMEVYGIPEHIQKNKEIIGEMRSGTGFDLDTNTISDNLDKAKNGQFNRKFSAIFSCPPYSNTQELSGDEENTLFEHYPDSAMSAKDFVREFGFNLVALSGIILKPKGRFLMQFNQQHAQVLACILAESGKFSDIELLNATAQHSLSGDTQLFVSAIRNNETNEAAIQQAQPDTDEDFMRVRSPKTYHSYVNRGIIKDHSIVVNANRASKAKS